MSHTLCGSPSVLIEGLRRLRLDPSFDCPPFAFSETTSRINPNCATTCKRIRKLEKRKRY